MDFVEIERTLFLLMLKCYNLLNSSILLFIEDVKRKTTK